MTSTWSAPGTIGIDSAKSGAEVMQHRMTAAAFKEVRKRPGVFLAYFLLRRAFRNTPQFRGNIAGTLIAIVDKQWIGRFERAGQLLLSGQAKAFFRSELTRHQVITVETGSRKKVDMDVLRGFAQTIVVADSPQALSKTMRLAADAMFVVEKPSARHVIAIRKLAGRCRVELGEAEKLVHQDWDVIDALLCRQVLGDNAFESSAMQDSITEVQPRLSELPGYAKAKPWAAELAADVASWRNGTLEWSQVDRAALLTGPPGVGKSFLAGALAAELQVALVATSPGQWQSSGGGYLGDMLKAMRASFEEARSNAPAVLFLDELDSIGNRQHQSQHAFYETQVVNLFLELTGSASKWPGVILLGATNRPDDIDRAVLRSGRFERHIRLESPTPDERAEILSYHLSGPCLQEVRPLTDLLEQYSPADLEWLARVAKRRARAEGRAVEIVDVERSMPQRLKLPADVLRRVALHECGHALIALDSGFVESVIVSVTDTILDDPARQSGGKAHFEMKDSFLQTEDFLRAQIRIALAGTVAEQVGMGGRSTGGAGSRGSDLDLATSIAMRMVASYGMGPVPRLYADLDRITESFRPSPDISREIDRILREEWDKCRSSLTRDRDRLLAMAADLVRQRRIALAP